LLLGVSIIFGTQLNAQQIEVELRYNGEQDLYEVYAIPDANNSFYFVGGGSQLSLVLPQDIENVSLNIQSIAGGFWSDNSRIFAPEADPVHDFHGIATNGAAVEFLEGVETLLFTFTLPNGECRSDVRLFNNEIDPPSTASGMENGDFKNFFANVFEPFDNTWEKNHHSIDATCAYAPVVRGSELIVEQNKSAELCLAIIDENLEDSFTAKYCDNYLPSNNGTTEVKIVDEKLCLFYTPNNGFVGTEDICIEVCDQSGLCNTVFIPVKVKAKILEAKIDAYANACQNVIDWSITGQSTIAYFELQRSKSGQQFTTLERYESSNQVDRQLFRRQDEATEGDHYYRLKLVASDESYEFSNEVFVASNCELNQGISIFPNPVAHFNPIMTVKFLAETKKVNLVISNPLGQVQKRLQLEVEKGVNTIQLNVSDLATGAYYISIEGKETQAQAFSKIDERF